jgi:WD40 repeat protein
VLVAMQVFVSGVGERGGAVVLVDTLAPPNAATSATMLSTRGAVPSTLCLVPSSSSSGGGPGAVLVVGDDAGEVRGYDVRVLDANKPLWSTRQQQQQQQQSAAAGGSSGSNGITSLTCWDAAWMGGGSVVSVFDSSGSSSGGCGLGDLVACGSKDGSIRLLNVQTGSVIQQLSSAHYTERKGLLERVGLGGAGRAGSGGLDDSSNSVVLKACPAGAVPAAVSGVHACAEGLVSVGWDGAVRFAPFAQLLNEWSARTVDG